MKYAKLDGEPAEVAEGIYEHYLPRFAVTSFAEGYYWTYCRHQ